jgi:hypothetical protein
MIDHFAMFIGHFSPAELLLRLNKTVPVLPIAIGVSYPDLLWSVLVWFKKEEVEINAKNPLQNKIKFTKYPYSHSLVLSAILSLVPAVILGLVYHRPLVGVFFLIAAVSHWLLDTIMHLPDLPVLGFGKDKKVGLSVWNHPRFGFFFEYAFFVASTLLFVPTQKWLALLLGGTVLHSINANSFFGFTKSNPTKSSMAYAALALVGFGAAISWFTLAMT